MTITSSSDIHLYPFRHLHFSESRTSPRIAIQIQSRPEYLSLFSSLCQPVFPSWGTKDYPTTTTHRFSCRATEMQFYPAMSFVTHWDRKIIVAAAAYSRKMQLCCFCWCNLLAVAPAIYQAPNSTAWHGLLWLTGWLTDYGWMNEWMARYKEKYLPSQPTNQRTIESYVHTLTRVTRLIVPRDVCKNRALICSWLDNNAQRRRRVWGRSPNANNHCGAFCTIYYKPADLDSEVNTNQ